MSYLFFNFFIYLSQSDLTQSWFQPLDWRLCVLPVSKCVLATTEIVLCGSRVDLAALPTTVSAEIVFENDQIKKRAIEEAFTFWERFS